MNVVDKFKELDKKKKICFLSVVVVVFIIIIIGMCASCNSCGGTTNNNKNNENISKNNETNDKSSANKEKNSKKTEKTTDKSTEESKDETSSENETNEDVTTSSSDAVSNDTQASIEDVTVSTTVEQTTTAAIDNSQTTSNVGDGIIRLNGNNITYGGVGATINGSEVTITAAGEYYVTGTLNDGRIIVNADSDADITINLMGVNISNADSCCIYVISADKVVLNLNDGTDNIINDGKSYVYDDATEEEPNAAIFSKDDLVIEGNGKLTVTGNFNNGIASKDDLRINGGTVVVTAVNNGLKGKDAIEMSNANVTVIAGGDGLKADNEEVSMGGIYIESGTYNITASEDGMQATGNILINGGTFNIDSQDDSIHANTNVTVANGTIQMASGDDGLNAAGGNDSSSSSNQQGGMRPGMGSFSGSTGTITFSGGTLIVDASGDGIDSNGTVKYDAGTVTVYGPTTGGNGTLDYDSMWTQNGGTFVGMGTKDMAQMPSGGTQYSVMVTFTSTYQSGTVVTVKNSSGTTVLETISKKSFQNLVFSNPNLAQGEYTIYINGTEYTTFTINSTLTTVGSSGGGNNRPW